MTDPWEIVRDAISTIGVLTAIIISIIGLAKSSRQKQNDQLDVIEKVLNDHILDDEHSITELQTNVKHLTDNVNNKLDRIINEFE